MISGLSVWRGADLAGATDWIHPLTSGDVDELDWALDFAKGRVLAWSAVTPDDFPLPRLANRLARIGDAVERGRGLALLRGLPVDRYTEDDLRWMYWGIGTHLGTPRYQNAFGELIGEVRDEVRYYGEVQQPGVGQTPTPTSRARARTTGPLRFHTDRCDVVALLCVRRARAGGISKVVSTTAVANEIERRRPDLAKLLWLPYVRSRAGEEVGGEHLTYSMPVFAMRDGYFTSHYSRTFVELAQALPGVPKLTAAQHTALDLLAEVAEELSYAMELEPGDIQLLNNHVIYHARTAFEDDAAGGQDRLLFRLWLSTPNSRPLPEGFDVLWQSIAPGQPRGGVRQQGTAVPR